MIIVVSGTPSIIQVLKKNIKVLWDQLTRKYGILLHLYNKISKPRQNHTTFILVQVTLHPPCLLHQGHSLQPLAHFPCLNWVQAYFVHFQLVFVMILLIVNLTRNGSEIGYLSPGCSRCSKIHQYLTVQRYGATSVISHSLQLHLLGCLNSLLRCGNFRFTESFVLKCSEQLLRLAKSYRPEDIG